MKEELDGGEKAEEKNGRKNSRSRWTKRRTIQ
jgi:hypothetical protein